MGYPPEADNPNSALPPTRTTRGYT